MAWTYLLIASFFEIVFAISLKYTEGFSKLLPSTVTVIAGIASFFILSQALKTLSVGTAYAAWTGIGTVGTAILGILLFRESRDIIRVFCIVLIVAGIAGLKLTEPN